MKTLLLLLFPISLFANTISEDNYIKVEYLGYSAGKYSLLVTSKQNASCNPDITITWTEAHIGNVFPDTKGKNQINNNAIAGQSTQFFLTGQYKATATFTITVLSICDWKGSMPSQVTVTVGSTTLPITLDYFKAWKQNHAVAFEWKSEVEDNVSAYTIQHSTDGYEWDDIAIVFASGPQVYKYRAESLPKQASLLFGLVVLMFAGIVIKYRKVFVIVGLLLLSASSCTKQTVKPVQQIENFSGYYRLKIADNNGAIEYSPITKIP